MFVLICSRTFFSKVIKNWPKPLIKIMPRAKKRSHQSLITPRDSHRGRAAKPKLLRRRIKISVTKKYENIRKYSSIHEYTWITSRLIFNFNRKLVGKLVWGWSDQFLISLESFLYFEVYIGWIPWIWKVHLKVASRFFFETCENFRTEPRYEKFEKSRNTL